MQNLPPILSNEEQYTLEVNSLPHLTRLEQRSLEQEAREGNVEAQQQLIEACLHIVMLYAYRFSAIYLPGELLDLVQVGNLTLVERLSYALERAAAPIPYLCVAARREMRNYCIYHSRLIHVPPFAEALKRVPEVESLDASSLASLLVEPQPAEQSGFHATYDALHQAIKVLPNKQRQAVIARIEGNGTLDDSQQNAYYQAVGRLRRLLNS